MIERVFEPGPTRTGRIICATGSASSIVARSWVSASFDGGAHVEVWFQDAAAGSDAPAPGRGKPADWTLHNADRHWVEIPDGTEFIQYRVSAIEGPGVIAVEQQAK